MQYRIFCIGYRLDDTLNGKFCFHFTMNISFLRIIGTSYLCLGTQPLFVFRDTVFVLRDKIAVRGAGLNRCLC
jgi:hypothetical protein